MAPKLTLLQRFSRPLKVAIQVGVLVVILAGAFLFLRTTDPLIGPIAMTNIAIMPRLRVVFSCLLIT